VALVARAYVALGGQPALGLTGATAVRLLGAAAVLALPTILMGGTLPAAVRAVVREQDRQRRWVAILYGLNALGAVCGAGLGTFWLLAALGTRGTIWAASAVELAVAVAAWSWVRRAVAGRAPHAESTLPRRSAARARRIAPGPAPAPIVTAPVPPRFIYALAASVGFSFFLMELVWYRMLGPILGGTTYTFGLLLAVALLGIGLGGASYAVIFQQRRPTLGTFALTCGGEAVCLAIPFALGDRLAVQAALWTEASATFLEHVTSWTGIALIVVFPAALLSGLQYPILVSLLGEGEQRIGRQVGWCGAWNTIGAIAGSLCGGFGALPLLSAPGAWRLVALLLATVGLGAAIVAVWGQSRPWRRLALPVVLTAAAVSLITYDGPTAVWRHSGIGAGRVALPADRAPNSMRDWAHRRRRRLLWEADGVEASIGLVTDNALSFYVNGKCDGNALDDAGTQIMLGMLPALLHPAPQSGLVVGLGTGESAGWLAEVDEIERVEVVELEPAVDEMARRCAAVNFNVLEHPKVHRRYADAREVLMTARQRYDLIVSEPSNPYRAGVANLFTREFYTVAQQALQPGGLFVQWLQAYEVDVPTVRTVFATLRSVFGFVEVWQSQRGDLLLVCAAEARPLPVAALRSKLLREPFRSALANAWRVTDLEGVCSRYVAGTELVERWSNWPQQAPNTDDRNRVEYGFARTVGADAGFSVSVLAREAEASGGARPWVTDGELDWERVRDHRQIFAATWSGDTSVPRDASPRQRWRARFLQAYYGGAATREMVDMWEATPYEAVFPSEVAILALAYADVGDPRALPLAEQLASYYPAESASLVTLTRWRQDDVAFPRH
ncbi:MAG: fused MFS/spermidine synthase, partial [Pirellulaceae bacterium]|nr:fused MFS/spermidine synthase [Pirellulaceae bacterium]